MPPLIVAALFVYAGQCFHSKSISLKCSRGPKWAEGGDNKDIIFEKCGNDTKKRPLTRDLAERTRFELVVR